MQNCVASVTNKDRKIELLKFIYSEKATNFCKISTLDLSYVVTVKSTVEISQNFVVFSDEYRVFQLDMLHFKRLLGHQKSTFKS